MLSALSAVYHLILLIISCGYAVFLSYSAVSRVLGNPPCAWLWNETILFEVFEVSAAAFLRFTAALDEQCSFLDVAPETFGTESAWTKYYN